MSLEKQNYENVKDPCCPTCKKSIAHILLFERLRENNACAKIIREKKDKTRSPGYRLAFSLLLDQVEARFKRLEEETQLSLGF